MNTFDIILSRRSYRGQYLDQPVPREDLIRIMQAGLAAPSGCNKQTTSLIAVDDPEVLEQVKAVIDPPIGENCPAMICVLTQRINAYRDRCFSVHDYSAAIENMLLVVEELGYAACWYEGHVTDTDRIGDKIAAVLNVPEDYELICVMPVGKPAQEPVIPKKKTFFERAWFNGFGQTISMEKSCGAVIYTMIDEEPHFVVIGTRADNIGLPKGHVEPGETETEAALREIREETGLNVELNERFRTVEEHPLPHKDSLKQVVYFLAQFQDQEPVPEDTEEIRSIRLLKYEDAMKELTFPGDRRVLMEAHQYMERHKIDG